MFEFRASLPAKLVTMAHFFLTWFLAVAAAPAAQAQNGPASGWPGLWGPGRDGDALADGAPVRPRAFKELWRRRTAGGYSEIIVDGRLAYTMELGDGVDYVVALDLDSGRDRWRASMDRRIAAHEGSHDGPVSTPVILSWDAWWTSGKLPQCIGSKRSHWSEAVRP